MGLRRKEKVKRQVDHLAGMINDAREFRRRESIEDTWRRMVDLYRGRQVPLTPTQEDRIVINISKSVIDSIVPAVAMNVPKMALTARHWEEEAAATIAQNVLDYQFSTYNFKKPMNRCLTDSLIMGIGVCKVGWKFVEEDAQRPHDEMDTEYQDLINQVDQFGADNPDLAGDLPDDDMVASSIPTVQRAIVADHPMLERVSPFDIFVDPLAVAWDERTWEAQRIYRPLSEVQEDERYDAAARKKVKATHTERSGDLGGNDSYQTETGSAARRQKSLVCVWEFWHLTEGFMCVFADGCDEFLIPPSPQPYAYGSPFVYILDTEIPEVLYPMGQLEAIEPLQHELNKTRSQQMNHRKKNGRKYVIDPQAFDEEGVGQLLSDADNVIVKVQPGIALEKAILPVQQNTSMSADQYQARDQIIEDVQLVSARNEYQFNQEANRRKTATEANIVNDTARSRAEYKIGQYQQFCTEIARKVLQLDQQMLPPDQVAYIVGADGLTYWFEYQPQDIAGEFHFEVQAGSTAPVDVGSKRREAAEMMTALAPLIPMGVLNPAALAEKILKSYGETSTAKFLMTPMVGGMPPAPGPGGTGGPGAPSPTDGPQATPMQAAQQGVSPEMAQMQQMPGTQRANVPSPDGP